MAQKLKSDSLGVDINTMTTLNPVYAGVADALQVELSLCEELLDVVQRKQDAVVRVDADLILETTKCEEEKAAELSRSTALRTNATLTLCHYLGAPAVSRLGELLEYMNEEGRAIITPLREKLIRVGTEVKRVNDINKHVLQNSQKRVSDFLKAVTTQDDGTGAYTSSGDHASRQVSLFNAEA